MASQRIQERIEEFWRQYTLERSQAVRVSRGMFLVFVFSALLFTWMTFTTRKPWSPLSEAKYLWDVFLPVTLLSAWGLTVKEDKLGRRVQSGGYTVIFQVVTRGVNKEAVLRSVSSVLYWAPKYLRNFQVWVVTEEDADRDFFDSLEARVLYVPRDYSTPMGSRFKTRALHYASRVRVEEGLNRRDVWVYFMDEESVVGEDTVLEIISFVEDQDREVGQGVITYPNFWGRNLLVSYQDSLRVGDDMSRFRLQAKLGKVYLGHHGSHLLVRADVEGKVGWDFGSVRAEDAVFGGSVTAEGYRWGFLQGFLYEQSPFTLQDFLRQRRRWVWGKLDLMRRVRTSRKLKLIHVLDLSLWLLSLPSEVLAILNLVYPTPMPGLIPSLISSFSFATVLYLYRLGHNVNATLAGSKWFPSALLNIALVPVLGGMEALSVWYGLLTYRRSWRIGFEIIRK